MFVVACFGLARGGTMQISEFKDVTFLKHMDATDFPSQCCCLKPMDMHLNVSKVQLQSINIATLSSMSHINGMGWPIIVK